MNSLGFSWCPFCQCKKVTCIGDFHGGYCAQCTACLARGPMCGTPELAVSHWNTRQLQGTLSFDKVDPIGQAGPQHPRPKGGT